MDAVAPAPCQHSWAFTTPGHIKCTKCPAIGQRWFTAQERREYKAGLAGKGPRWFHLMPRT
ncbi:hypothetical protein [Pseudomonas sp. ML96]|uniref:hypothetical protein n=1 Tax=Pseudomonas sp. ML96 TaxID=1523503 RepID=UPI0005BD3C87|nr:hypothetical protein [Pseudomonas sp. ML96]